MTLHTVSDTTRTGARKIRVSHLIAALGGAVLALAVITAVSQLNRSGQHHAAQVMAAQPQQRTTFVRPHGGQAETIADARNAVLPAHGGIAEGISDAQSTFAVQTSDLAVAVPAHGGLAETIAAAHAVGLTSSALGAVPARGGMAEALDARRASDVAAALAATRSPEAATAIRAKGGMAEALDAARPAP